MQLPQHCTLCPRACGANRAAGAVGVCGAGNTLRVARAAPVSYTHLTLPTTHTV